MCMCKHKTLLIVIFKLHFAMVHYKFIVGVIEVHSKRRMHHSKVVITAICKEH